MERGEAEGRRFGSGRERIGSDRIGNGCDWSEGRKWPRADGGGEYRNNPAVSLPSSVSGSIRITPKPIVCPPPYIRPGLSAWFSHEYNPTVKISKKSQASHGRCTCEILIRPLNQFTLTRKAYPVHLSRLYRFFPSRRKPVLRNPPCHRFSSPLPATTQRGAIQGTHDALLVPRRPFALTQHSGSVRLPLHSNLDLGGWRDAAHG